MAKIYVRNPDVGLQMMDGLLIVVLLALLPGAGNFAGAMLAEFWKTTPLLLNWALHAASGIVIAIVTLDLFPAATANLSGLWIAGSFAAGGLIYLLIQTSIDALQRKLGNGASRSTMWMIYIAVAIDLSSDGLVLGTGSVISLELAMSLAAGQLLADVPEGYAVAANLRDKGVSKPRRIALCISFFAYTIVASIAAYFLARDASPIWKSSALAFVAGILVVAAVEDMLEEAHDAQVDNRKSVLAFIGGFSLFTIVSTGLAGQM